MGGMKLEEDAAAEGGGALGALPPDPSPPMLLRCSAEPVITAGPDGLLVSTFTNGGPPTAFVVEATTGGRCCFLLCRAVVGRAADALAAMLADTAVTGNLPALSSASLSESEKDPSIRSPSMLAIFGLFASLFGLLVALIVMDTELTGGWTPCLTDLGSM